jgi:hypothetical protein
MTGNMPIASHLVSDAESLAERKFITFVGLFARPTATNCGIGGFQASLWMQ